MSRLDENRVLVVEDDARLPGLLEFLLRNAGFDVRTVGSCGNILDALGRERFSLLVLNLSTPGADCFAVCEAVRQRVSTPIVVLSDAADESHIVRAFAAGADEHFTKPFSPRMFLARVAAILRRAEYDRDLDDTVEADGVELNVATQTLRCDGKDVRLSRIETVLLQTLLASAGQMVTSQQLSEAAWDRREWTEERQALKQRIHRLRRKLAAHTRVADRLRATRNEGYCWGGTEFLGPKSI